MGEQGRGKREVGAAGVLRAAQTPSQGATRLSISHGSKPLEFKINIRLLKVDSNSHLKKCKPKLRDFTKKLTGTLGKMFMSSNTKSKNGGRRVLDGRTLQSSDSVRTGLGHWAQGPPGYVVGPVSYYVGVIIV